MNSDVDNNSDAIYRSLLAWLQHDSGQPPAHYSEGEFTAADLEMDELDVLDFEDLDFAPDRTGEAATCPQPLSLGDIPTVQNRFQALLKRRLQDEIELHPPRFPWETEIGNYESDNSVESTDIWGSDLGLSMSLLPNFSLPVFLPKDVLVQLLEACQQAVQSPQQLGAKMVRAVLSLFPQQPQFLNELAGMVLLYPTRSPQEQQLFTDSYEAASDKQQMALSLLAAREMLKGLTLMVSRSQPSVQREWQTAVGLVTLQAEYELENKVPKLRVQCRLPRGGSITLRTGQAEATAQRIYPGYLSVESFDLPPNQSYSLEIRFQELEQQPLIFAIALTA
ncbi:hypothetical protein H6F77_09495 [Microcoleus sp. FACHB-831]|uniref:hypothetical protein n=1 Tax=Microcoleus sp. FACHB-831 TaxID=2692827 RepID=UPI0016852B88|nr:hypothetical protein [Microcoleus sp. FACHB-831]MBD1921322.1 hypothetical protein [Microcoleus sp. FACHB-831]